MSGLSSHVHKNVIIHVSSLLFFINSFIFKQTKILQFKKMLRMHFFKKEEQQNQKPIAHNFDIVWLIVSPPEILRLFTSNEYSATSINNSFYFKKILFPNKTIFKTNQMFQNKVNFVRFEIENDLLFS